MNKFSNSLIREHVRDYNMINFSLFIIIYGSMITNHDAINKYRACMSKIEGEYIENVYRFVYIPPK